MAKYAYIKKKSHGTFRVVFESYDGIVDDFIEDMILRRYSESTVSTYLGGLKVLFLFLKETGSDRLQEVATADLEEYGSFLRRLGRTENTRHTYLRIMKKFFSWLEEKGHIFIDPAASMVIGKPKRSVLPTPSAGDMKKLLAAPDSTTAFGIRDRAMIETAYSCGLRLGELTSLDIFSISLDAGTLRIAGKGSKERTLPLSRHAVLWLKRYLSEVRDRLLGGDVDEAALWISNFGGRIKSGTITLTFGKYSVEAGLKRISVHAVRRACATHMLQNGAHPVQIQMMLGHKSLRTLSHYLKMTVKELSETHRKSRPGK